HPASVRARALGNGLAPTDPSSPLNPASIGAYRVVTVQFASIQEFRDVTLNGTDVTGLQLARFPYASLSGRLGATGPAYSLGFSQYAERTYDVSTSDTIMLRGVPMPVDDRVASSGGVL